MSTFAKSLVYGAVEVVTGGRGIARRIGGEVIRFPARFSRYYEQDYEPETFRFLREHCREGDVVLDIGAHIGLFTVVAARLVGPTGHVYSFEPTPNTRKTLERTVQLNDVADWVHIHGEAVSRESGTATFFDTGHPGSNANSLVPSTKQHQRELRVETTSLDDFVAARASRLDVVKIDAEGNELAVLQGGERVLREHRPALALALHPDAVRTAGDSLSEVWALLDALGMRVTLEGIVLEHETFCAKQELFDVHCVPVDA